MAEIPHAEQSAVSIVETIHEIAVEHEPQGQQIGVVVTPPPDLHVQMNNILLRPDQLYISKYLLPNYTRHMVGETSFKGGGSGDPAYESHNHPIDNDETWTDTLRPGDLVSLSPVKGDQLYIVENQVVKL